MCKASYFKEFTLFFSAWPLFAHILILEKIKKFHKFVTIVCSEYRFSTLGAEKSFKNI